MMRKNSLIASKWMAIALVALTTRFICQPTMARADDTAPRAATPDAAPSAVDVSALLNQLWHPDADLRLAAGKKLLDHSHLLTDSADEIAESIALCHPNDDNDLRRFGRRALLRMGSAAMPAAIAHLADDDELIAALAEPGDSTSIPPFIGLIAANKALSRDADGWSDQTGIKQALLVSGPAAVAGPLTEALKKNRDSLALLVAVHDLCGPEFAAAVPVLVERLADESESRCILAAKSLVHIGDAALPSLRDALRNRSRRAAALYAIDQLAVQATSLADPLFDLADSDETITNEFVLAKYGCLPGEMTVGELARRVLRSIHPPADRFLALEHAERLSSRLAQGNYPIGLHDLRPDGKQLADSLAIALSRESTAVRIDRLCARAMYDAAGDKQRERRARRSVLADERFFRTKMTAVWNRVAPDDPRLVEAVLRLIEAADYREYPPVYDDGCGGLSWIDLLFLREAVQHRPRAYLPRLREMLAGDDVDRTKALYFFAHLGPHDREAVHAAYTTLASDEPDARKAALLLLEAHAQPSERLTAAAFDRFRHDDDNQIRESALSLLVRNPEFLPPYTTSLLEIHLEIIESATAQSPTDEAAATATNLLRGAMDMLACIGPAAAEAAPTLVRIAESKDDVWRQGAIAALGAIRGDRNRALPILERAFAAARRQKPTALAWYELAGYGSSSRCEAAACLRSIGRYGTASQDFIEPLTNAALQKPAVVFDPKSSERERANVYEKEIAVEAAIALGRIGAHGRDALPQLREAILRRDFDSEDRSRQLALAIAIVRIDSEADGISDSRISRHQPADLAAVMEILRTATLADITDSIAEELVVLGKSHDEIAARLRVLFLQKSRILNDAPAPPWR